MLVIKDQFYKISFIITYGENAKLIVDTRNAFERYGIKKENILKA